MLPPAARHHPASPRVDSLAGTVDEFLTRQSGFGWSGNVLLRDHGTTLLAKGYGEAAPQTAYSATTVFDIGSFAKSFTAAAIVRLEELGKLDVRDALAKHLPATPTDKREITIHQLLTHTAGVATDFPFTDPAVPYEDVARDEALRRIFAAPVEFPAGSRGQYSNAGYILLAAVVEQVAGKPFRTFLRDEIFARAGLRDTYFWGDAALARMPVAVGHDGYGAVVQDPRILSATTWCDLGGGQIVSTLADLERWREALAAGRVIRGFARVWSPQTAKPLMSDRYYGYGWLIHTTPRGTTLIEHGGEVIGAGCQLSWYREDDVLLITSTNVRHDVYPTRNGIDRPLRDILFGGGEVTWLPPWRSEVPDDVFGDYKLPTGGTLTIHRRGRRAFIGATGQDAVDLLAQGSDAVRARRAELTRTATAVFEGLVRGDLEPLRRAAGEGGQPAVSR